MPLPSRAPSRWVVFRGGILSAAAVVLAACGGEPSQTTAEHVVDDRGQAHATVARGRVVSLIPAVTEMIVSLGAGDRLVARTRYDEQPELAHLPSVGGGIDPSLEFLVELGPDVVFMWPEGDQGTGTLARRLADVGLPAYAAEIETLADLRRHLGNVGRLLGLTDRADSIRATIDAELASVRGALEGRPSRRVVYLVQADPPMSVGPGSFLDSLIAIAGGQNVFGDDGGHWPLVSMEEVVLRAPDVVVVPKTGHGWDTFPDEGADPSTRELAQTPGWEAVDAVRAGRVITVDASLFGRPGPRVGLAARYLAHRLHGVPLVASGGR